MGFSFEKEIDNFISRVNSMRETSEVLMKEINKILISKVKSFNSWVSRNTQKTEKAKDGKLAVTILPSSLGQFQKHLREVQSTLIANKTLPRTFVVSLISTYDAFLGRLIRGVFFAKPETLRASEKTLSYSELLSFGSFKDAKEHIIETEIESILRKSHSDQFIWLEGRLGIPLKKDLDVWPQFIEVTERRHLFVHTGGVVTSGYFQTCETHGFNFEKKPKIGEELSVTKEYFDKACECILEIGIKLAHVIWRKVQPDKANNIDSNLNRVCVDLINNGQYELVIKLLDFVIKCKAWKSSMQMKLYFELNLAQAHKWKGNKEKCKEILSSRDFSELSDKYKLAYAVLKDNFQEAAQIMKRIGKKGEVGQLEYRLWPVFKKFREKKIFEETYQQIFKEKFKIETEKMAEFEDKNQSGDTSINPAGIIG